MYALKICSSTRTYTHMLVQETSFGDPILTHSLGSSPGPLPYAELRLERLKRGGHENAGHAAQPDKLCTQEQRESAIPTRSRAASMSNHVRHQPSLAVFVRRPEPNSTICRSRKIPSFHVVKETSSSLRSLRFCDKLPLLRAAPLSFDPAIRPSEPHSVANCAPSRYVGASKYPASSRIWQGKPRSRRHHAALRHFQQ